MKKRILCLLFCISLMLSSCSKLNGINVLGQPTDFHDGIAFVQENPYEVIAIDSNGEQLFKLNTEDFNLIKPQNFCNGISICGNYIIDKNGEIIASPQKLGYDWLIPYNVNGYVLAIRITKQFQSNIYEMGVIDNAGEWKTALSSNNYIMEIFKNEQLDKDKFFRAIYSDLEYYYDTSTNGVNDIDITYYIDFNVDGIVTFGIPSGINHKYYSIDLAKESILKNEEYKMFYYIDIDSQTWQSKNQRFEIEEYEAKNTYKDVVLCWKLDRNEEFENIYYLYDKTNGNLICDLSNYPQKAEYDPEYKYNDGYLFISLANENNDVYWCLFDKQGTLILNIPYEYESCCHALSKDGFIFEDGSNNFFLYNMHGEKEKLDITNISEFSEGLVWVETTNDTWEAIDVLGNVIIALN